MQTILVLQSASAGVIYLNGRMLGEIDKEHTLSAPVSPTGALILQMYPFERDLLPLALRLALSRGVPLLNETPDPRYSAALWHESVLELELTPQRLPFADSERFLFEVSGIRFFILGTDPPQLICEAPSGTFLYLLPHGAQQPAVTPLQNALLLSGRLEGDDEYALLLSNDASQELLSLTGRSISLLEDRNTLRLLRPLGDIVGHAQLETWQNADKGWMLVESEPMWLNGSPNLPQTPEETAVAAVEAAQLGVLQEAQSYCAPLSDCMEVLKRAQNYSGCVPLRYPLPGGEAAVGLMKMDGALLRITPLYYQAVRGGIHGAWQLQAMRLVENS